LDTVIIIDGTAAALAGEEILLQQGVKVGVMSRPTELGSACGFCLRVERKDLAKAVLVLDKAEVKIGGVYDQKADKLGRWKYTPLNEELWRP
jgi:hypothetical protein